MKHIAEINNSNSALNDWLLQFDRSLVIKAIENLNPAMAMIIIDQHHQVIFWSQGMQLISNTSQQQMVGKACPVEFSINEQTEQSIISLALNHHTTHDYNKYWQVVNDQHGHFAGAIISLSAIQQDKTHRPLIENSRYEKHVDFHGIISRSPTMRPVFQLIENAARTEATVLVRGESGSGKELVAHAIHDLSPRHGTPFLAINCAALSSTLLESELFGHVRGAFTGAIKDHSGLFERANGGTLFLDEVAEMPLELQAKLLRVVQERNYMPVGANHSVNVDVRLVAATHRSLREEVKAGRFREDLMYRLRVVPIFIPPLRDRREDIGLLLWHFIRLHNNETLRIIEKIEPQAMRVLLDHLWPGNIRELQNVIEYAFVVGRGTSLKLSELPPEFRETQSPTAKSTLDVQAISPEQEAEAISLALENNHGKINAAANALGMSRATFWRKRKLYGL